MVVDVLAAAAANALVTLLGAGEHWDGESIIEGEVMCTFEVATDRSSTTDQRLQVQDGGSRQKPPSYSLWKAGLPRGGVVG